MKPLLVYADREHVGRCGTCQAPIEWYRSVGSGTAIPFDSPVVQQGEGPRTHGRPTMFLKRPESVVHFATCPQAATWRKRKPLRGRA